MDNYIGKKLEGRYEIQELIGVGGMANVYKAYDIIDEKYVAVKILRDEFAENEEFVRRFKTESKAIAVLSHPNIVKVYDVTFTNRIQSIIMEYVDGITLKEYIDQQGVLKWKEAVHFITQILRALQHAHDKGIVHRDIKPQNIMLLQDGTIKVMDFGIARFARNEPITETNKAIGSVHYISPEQARGEITDEKTDIYSVGVMLFEMLTGQLPFEAEDPVSVALKQISDKPKLPREINDTIPEGLEDITIRAMQKDVALRYQSAAEMLKDIEEFKQNPSIQFEYKYLMEDNSPTKYMDAINKGKQNPVTEENEEEENGKKKPPMTLILAGIASAVVIVTIIVLVLIFTGATGGKGKDILVPNLVGQNYLDVKNNSEYSQINFEETTQYSSEHEANVIIAQDPVSTGNRTMKANGTIKVTLSLGAKKATVPDVYKSDIVTATAKLKESGFTNIKEISKFSDETEGTVISTNPERGAEAAVDEVIEIYVSGGKEVQYTFVPSLKGMTLSEATQALEKKNLKVGQRQYKDSEQPADTVLEQSPADKTSVQEGSAVDLVLSNGNAPQKTVTVKVDLASSNVKSEVSVKAYLDGDLINEKKCYPNESKTWELGITGTNGTKTLTIRINNQLYQSIRVDFNSGTSKVENTNPVKDPADESKEPSQAVSQPDVSSKQPVDSSKDTGRRTDDDD